MVIIPKSITIALKPHSDLQVYFHEHVVPLLDQLGNKLTQLSLEKYFTFFWLVMRPIDQQIDFIALNIFRFKFVDVEAIGESCPKLQNLRLSRILSFCNTHSPR